MQCSLHKRTKTDVEFWWCRQSALVRTSAFFGASCRCTKAVGYSNVSNCLACQISLRQVLLLEIRYFLNYVYERAWSMECNCNFGNLGIAASVMQWIPLRWSLPSALSIYTFSLRKRNNVRVWCYVSENSFFFSPLKLSLNPLATDQIKNLLSFFFPGI